MDLVPYLPPTDVIYAQVPHINDIKLFFSKQVMSSA